MCLTIGTLSHPRPGGPKNPETQMQNPARAATPEEVEGVLRTAHSQLEIVIARVGSMG
jgi:hypothetical protein